MSAYSLGNLLFNQSKNPIEKTYLERAENAAIHWDRDGTYFEYKETKER